MSRDQDGARDDELMMRFKRGDVSAFEELYDRYAVQLFGFCTRLLGDQADAEDALQETFAKVVDAKDGFRASGRFRSWIFTIARYVCVDRARVARTERRGLERVNAPDVISTPEPAALARAEVGRLLLELPIEQREILILHWIHGYSHGEIASMLGGTEAGVRQKSYRALKALRHQLGTATKEET